MITLQKSHTFKYKNHQYKGTCKFQLGFKHLYYGLIVYKYPLCCVYQFIKETWYCVPSALKRYKDHGLIWGSYPIVMSKKLGEHVPCDKCLNKRSTMLQLLKDTLKEIK